MSSESVASRDAIARDLDPMHPRARHLERRQEERTEHFLAAGDLELGPREGIGAGEHHVHGQASAALGDEPFLRRGHDLCGRLPGRIGVEEDLEAPFVDPHGLANRLELGLALHRPREIEFDIERNELEAVERAVVPHRHDVVEAVDADAPPPRATRPVRNVLARAIVEDLLELALPCSPT